MNYLVHYKRGLVFATLEEASAFCDEVMRKTGYVLCITETKRKVTHIYEF